MEETEERLSHEQLEQEVNRASAEWAEGHYAAAFARYLDLAGRRLRQAGRAANLMAADLLVLERLAAMATLFGQIERADSIFAAMAGLTREAGNPCGMRYIELHRLHLALSTGRLDAVRQIIEDMERSWFGPLPGLRMTSEGLAAWENGVPTPGCQSQDRTVLLIRLLFALGWTLVANGQYGDGLVCYARAIELARDEGAPPEARAVLLPVRLRQAGAMLERGDLDSCGSRLVAMADEVAAPRRIAQRVQWLELRLRLALLRGEYGTAIAVGSDMVRICAMSGFARALAASRLNLANALLLVNHTRYAVALADEVLIAPDLSPALASRARLVLDLAAARVQSPADGLPPSSVTQMWRRPGWGTRTAAAPKAAATPPALPPAAGFLDMFNDHATLFQWHLGQRDLQQSHDALRQMRETFANTDSTLIELRLRALGALQAYYEDRLPEVQAELAGLLPRLRGSGLRPELWQMLRLAGWSATRLGRSRRDAVFLNAEADRLLESIGAGLDPADRAVYLLNKWTADEEVLAGQVDRLIEARRRMQRSIALLRPFRAIAVWREIRTLLNRVEDYRARMAVEAVSSAGRHAERLAFPQADRAVVAFLVLPDRVVTICLGHWRVDFAVTAMTRQDLRDRVATWHHALVASDSRLRDLSAIRAPAPPSLTTAEATATELARDLGLPELLADLSEKVRTISFVPDDVLAGFPFAALRWQDRAIIQDRAVTLDFSVRRRPRVKRKVSERGVVIAVPAGAPPTDEFPAVPPLPNARVETAAVSSWFARHVHAVDRLDGIDVDKARVMAALPGAAFLHIASHGIFRPEAPHLSGLVLTPEGTRTELLSLTELAKLDFTSASLVTLSSCWSADSFVLPGRRILSLPETLWRAGAQSVLACLWPVDDQAAVIFMRRFYDHLDRLSRAEALRQTQSECRSGAMGEAARSQFFWAGFTLYGEEGPLFRSER